MPTSGATTTASSTSFSKSSTSISSGRRKPFLFFSNLLWRRKKVLEIGEIDDIIFDRNHRTRSEPSVISYNCSTAAMTSHHNSHDGHSQRHYKNASTLTMTPGRCRDLDQDMHALRLSRQDNPFVQKVLASRESLIDTLDDQSDDAILMASEEINPDCEDPLSMLSRNEVKEHMIRSPPPTSWPRSPQYMFTFNQDNNLTISSHSSDEESGFNANQPVRAQDLFLRTTSVPATEVGGYRVGGENSSLGQNMALSRPKSKSVNMSSQYGGLSSTGESESSLDMPAASPGSASMILRPKCLFEQEEGTGMRRFK